MPYWRAVQCQTQREAMARDNLEELGVTCFFPYRWALIWQRHQRIWRKRAYFSGYLFADLERPHLVGDVMGVERILGEVAIPDPVIQTIVDLTDEDGCIRESLVKTGDEVPLGNFTVELENLDERVATVLFPIFGHHWPATLPIARLYGILRIPEKKRSVAKPSEPSSRARP